MKKIVSIILVLMSFSVFSQYNTSYDINRIADALEEQNQQRQFDEMRRTTERTLYRMDREREQQRLTIERHRNYFYSAIERAVPDARSIINTGEFRSWLVKCKLINDFRNAMVPVRWKKRKKWIIPIYLEPDSAIKILVAYKKYSSVKENEIRKKETDNVFFQSQMQKVKKVHPDAMLIMNDPEFLKWLNTQSVMKSVFEKTNDPVDIIPILEAYKKFLTAEDLRKKEYQKKIQLAKEQRIEKERIIKFYNEIEKKHPEVINIMQSSAFKRWINIQSLNTLNAYQTTKDPNVICQILDSYKKYSLGEKLKKLLVDAENGNYKAQYALGEFYEKKAISDSDFIIQAHMWYNIASSYGSNIAPEKVMKLEKCMSKNEKEKAIALCFDWLNRHKKK